MIMASKWFIDLKTCLLFIELGNRPSERLPTQKASTINYDLCFMIWFLLSILGSKGGLMSCNFELWEIEKFDKKLLQ